MRLALENVEARAASSLEHPNICTIYEFGEHQGQPFLVMPLLKGQTLREYQATVSAGSGSKALPFAELLRLAIEIAEGLEAAHEKGIIHRDIKPANIFITSKPTAQILDFGVAKLLHSEKKRAAADGPTTVAVSPSADTLDMTKTGAMVGTPSYMSPEQLLEEELDVRTDLFSFGLVLYEMATGQSAFTGDNAAALRFAILSQAPVPAVRLNRTLPPELSAIIDKSLQKDRSKRYQNAAEIVRDLHQVAQVPGRAIRRRWVLLGAAALVLVTAIVGGLYWRGQRHKLTSKDTVVLADFENKTGDPVFDDTLKTELSVALNQSPFLNVLSENKVAATLKLMTRPADTKLTPEVAQDLCERAGGKAYIAGSIAALGTNYVVSLKAANCETGDTLEQEQTIADNKEQVLHALGKAAANLRKGLGESLTSVRRHDANLEVATTSSLEALNAYSRGQRIENEQTAAAALPYYLHAIEIDPEFAVAYRSAGLSYAYMGLQERARDYQKKAFELRERTSDRERLSIEAAYYADVTGELRKAAQVYREMLDNYPNETAANLGLSTVYSKLGEYAEAVDIAQRLPKALGQSRNYYLLNMQRLDEYREYLKSLPLPELQNTADTGYLLAFIDGDRDAMARYLHMVGENGSGYTLASDTAAYFGHATQARELAERAVAADITADVQENGAISLAVAAQWEAAYGNTGSALQLATKAMALAPTSPAAGVESALAFALAGDSSRADALAHDLTQRFPVDEQMQSIWLPAIRGQIALNRKDSGQALRALGAPSQIEAGNIQFIMVGTCLYTSYVRGNAFLAAGDGKAAAPDFRRILDRSGLVDNCWTGALARLGIARANALQAKTSTGAGADAAHVRARAAYQNFLTLWKDADPDIPIYKEAKAEYAKLQ